MGQFETFLENLVRIGLEHYRKYYGIYRGVVSKNNDPNATGRVQAYVPAVGHRKEAFPDVWIMPAMSGAGANRGEFNPPEVGDAIWVSFASGDASMPQVYWGGWYGVPTKGKPEVPTEMAYQGGYPQRRGWVTRMGHVLVFDDEKGKEAVRIFWHKPEPGDPALTKRDQTADRTKGKHAKLAFESDGTVVIEDQNEASVTLNTTGITIKDKDGNTIVLSNGNLDITTSKEINLITPAVNLTKGADVPTVRGPDLLQWEAGHTHGTAWGPSSPPIVPPPQTILAKKTKVGR
jgi:hypothetical protein